MQLGSPYLDMICVTLYKQVLRTICDSHSLAFGEKLSNEIAVKMI